MFRILHFLFPNWANVYINHTENECDGPILEQQEETQENTVEEDNKQNLIIIKALPGTTKSAANSMRKEKNQMLLKVEPTTSENMAIAALEDQVNKLTLQVATLDGRVRAGEEAFLNLTKELTGQLNEIKIAIGRATMPMPPMPQPQEPRQQQPVLLRPRSIPNLAQTLGRATMPMPPMPQEPQQQQPVLLRPRSIPIPNSAQTQSLRLQLPFPNQGNTRFRGHYSSRGMQRPRF